MRRLLMVDIFAGLGGASQAMRDRGWRTYTVDRDPRFDVTVHADVARWSFGGLLGDWVDLAWFSVPCEEFARESMPWCKTGVPPSLDLLRHALRLRDEMKPRHWIIECVRGARPYFDPIIGPPIVQLGPSQSYLWGSAPMFIIPATCSRKERRSSKADAERSLVPYEVSHALAAAIEKAEGLPVVSTPGTCF